MPSTSGVAMFVRKLEDQIGRDLPESGRVVLAFSGGVASTLVAMVARKRCDLECLVAGVEGCPDFEAAKLARSYFDYRVAFISLDSEAILDTCRRLEGLRPRLSRRARDALVPLFAVHRGATGRRVLSGFGSPRIDAGIAAVLRHADIRAPIHVAALGRPVPRALVRGAAISLGLPADAVRMAHRPPPMGAGINRFLADLS